MDRINFVDDFLLRDRIENVLDDILNLEGLIGEQEKPDMQSCLRKTIIIYIASIIEALLVWKLKKKIKTEEISPNEEARYLKPQKIIEAGNLDLFIVKREKEVKKLTELDFNRMIDVCASRNVIQDEVLIKKLHKVRKMRNELHIGGVRMIRKRYTADNLNYVFTVLEETIKKVR